MKAKHAISGIWVELDLDADLLSIAWFCVTVHLTVSVILLVKKIPILFISILTKFQTVHHPQELPILLNLNPGNHKKPHKITCELINPLTLYLLGQVVTIFLWTL